MSLKTVKTKIRAIQKVRQVTKAMEAVSAVKMRRSQETAFCARPFALSALGLLHRLIDTGIGKAHHLVVPREKIEKVCIIVVTGDRGLAGALNHRILKKTHCFIEEKKYKKENVHILAIGKRGYEHFLRQGYTILDHKERWGEGIALGDPDSLGRSVISSYEKNIYDAVYVAYSNFESTFTHYAVLSQVLPLSFSEIESIIEGIVPLKGKYSDLKDTALHKEKKDYVYEPNKESVFDALLPYFVGIILYHSVLESNACEHSARMVAMKSASDRAGDVEKKFLRKYNKERQAGITGEVSEITSGIEALR
jgi:F-type H+-transporting ATPase subunit gamma